MMLHAKLFKAKFFQCCEGKIFAFGMLNLMHFESSTHVIHLGLISSIFRGFKSIESMELNHISTPLFFSVSFCILNIKYLSVPFYKTNKTFDTLEKGVK